MSKASQVEVMKLNTVSFRYNYFPEDGRKLGFIAQEVQRVTQDVVKTHNADLNKETAELEKKEVDILGMDYPKLIPVLVNAIQE